MDNFSGSTPAPLLLQTVRTVDVELTKVRDLDPTFMSVSEKSELLRALTHAIQQAQGLLVETLAVSADVADAEGFRSAGSWLVRHTREERSAAARLQRLADDALRHRLVREAMRDGAVSVRQAEVITKALDALGPDVSESIRLQAEQQLVALAEEFDAAELRQLGAGILEVIDPATFEDHARARLEDELRKAREATRLSIRRRGDGTSRLSGVLPDHVAARLKAFLNAFSSPRHDAAGDGGDPSPYVDPASGRRLPGNRVMGEALCAFLEAADPARMPIHGGAATSIIVTIDLDRLRAGLGLAVTGEERLTPAEVRRLACQANIIPAVLGGSAEVLDLGRSRRLFSPAQRKALAVRYPTCCVDGCDLPAAWCEAHHLDPWSKGGPTDLADGVLACPRHHHLFHDDRYDAALTSSGYRFAMRT
jgi:hypothetical protein